MIRQFISILVYMALVTVLHAEKRYIIISSGQEGAPYYEAAEFIRKVLDANFKQHQVINLSSEGSYQNFERLERRSCDLIIAQRDVVIEKYYSPTKPIRNFEVILPLFPEALQILVRHNGSAISLSEFTQLITDGKIPKIAIGPKNSASNTTIRELFSVLGVKLPAGIYLEEPGTVATDLFLKDSIDAIVYFAALPVKRMTGIPGLSAVTFSEDDVRKASVYFNALDTISFDLGLYHGNLGAKDNRVLTLGTQAFLVGNKDLNNILRSEQYEDLPRWIIQAAIDAENTPEHPSKHIVQNFSTGQFRVNDVKTLDILSNSNFKRFFSGIPVHTTTNHLLKLGRIDSERIFFIVIIILLSAIFVFLLYPFKSLKPIRLRQQYGHWPLIVMFSFVLLFFFAWLIQYFERVNYENFGIKGQILNLDVYDTIRWLLIFVFTNYDNNTFPLSTWGEVLTTLTFFLGTGAILTSFVWQYFVNIKLKKRNMGETTFSGKDHIVICGWNGKTSNLITKLHDEGIVSGESRKIVLLNDQLKEAKSLPDSLQVLHEEGRLTFLKGDPTDQHKFKHACIDKAHTVIIVSEGKSKLSDEKVLLTAYAISTYCKEIHKEQMDHIYMIAEVNDPFFEKKLLNADVNVVICSGNLINSLIVQSTICEGLYNPIRSLIEYNEGNDFYMVECKKYPKTIGHTYDELNIALRKKRLQLIGIKAMLLDEDGDIIIDTDELKRILREKHGLNDQFIINPLLDEECNYRTRETDEIILLADTNKDIKKLGDLVFE